MEIEVLRTGMGILNRFIMENKSRLDSNDMGDLAGAYRIMVRVEAEMLLELRHKTKTRGVEIEDDHYAFLREISGLDPKS